MSDLLKRFMEDESGPTIVEYAVMLFLVAIAVATAAPDISTAVKGVFTDAIKAMGQ
jgi:Flp pilus assembly pilin Flp